MMGLELSKSTKVSDTITAEFHKIIRTEIYDKYIRCTIGDYISEDDYIAGMDPIEMEDFVINNENPSEELLNALEAIESLFESFLIEQGGKDGSFKAANKKAKKKN